MAIGSGEKQIAHQLLTHGADPVPRNNKERTIFERLLFSGDAELARSLLFAPNQDLRITTMIQAARILGEEKVIEWLETPKTPTSDELELSRAMELAAERGLTKVFKQLVDHSSNCSLLNRIDSQVLRATVRRGQLEMFKTQWISLLRKGLSSNIRESLASAALSVDNVSSITPPHVPPRYPFQTHLSSLLYDAAMGGSTDIFELILVEGAMRTIDRGGGLGVYSEAMISSASTSSSAIVNQESTTKEIRDYGAQYLHAAVEAGHVDMVELLLRLGADANGIGPGCDNQNALCTALLGGKDAGMIERLLKAGAEVNAEMSCTFRDGHHRNRHHGTALAMALLGTWANKADETSSTVVKMLLDHGADANAADEEEGSVLQLAVSERHIGATELLLDYGADANKAGGTYGSPLIAAVALAKENSTGTEFIEILLKSGADVNAQYPGEYETAFRTALSKHKSLGQQIFQLFLAHNANVSATGRDGTQALYVACASGACDELRAEYLLSHGADVNASGGKYGNALQSACAASCTPTVVDLLIAKGAEVNSRGGRFGNALQAASRAGRPRTVEILLASGADVHTNNGEYGFALQAAATSSNPVQITKLLLSNGADINACGGKYGTALQAACSVRYWSKAEHAVRLLLRRGANPNVRGGKYGYALIRAVAQEWKSYPEGAVEAVNILLDSGADINSFHQTYGNALYAACYNYSIPVMELLIERGISLTQLSGEHEHALFVACLNSAPSALNDRRVRVLLDNGVDVNMRGRRYSCALEVAIKARNLAAAKLLIERGADVHVETANDGSLLDIAVRSSCGEIVDLLLENGA